MRGWPGIVLLGILAVALVLRVGVIVATPDFVPLFDAADFHRHGASISAGEGYPTPQLGVDGPSAFRPPLYPLALAVVQFVGGGWTAERLLGALLGVAAVLLIFLIARRVWGSRVAVVAGALAAIFPPLVVLNATLLSETLFLPLVLAAVLAVLRHRDEGGVGWAVAAGVLCGLAALTRTNGLVLIAALALGVWTVRPWRDRRVLVAPVALTVAALVVVAPWVIRNALAFDRFVGTGAQAGFALAGTYNEESRREAEHPGQPQSPNTLQTLRPVLERRDLDEAELVSRLNDRAMEFIRANPSYVLETMAWNVLRLGEVERNRSFEVSFQAQTIQAQGASRLASPVIPLSVYALLALAVLGVVAQLGLLPSRRAPLFVWAVPVLLVLPALAVYGLARYRAPLDPFLVMLAAVGLVGLVDRFGRTAGRSDGPVAEGASGQAA